MKPTLCQEIVIQRLSISSMRNSAVLTIGTSGMVESKPKKKDKKGKIPPFSIGDFSPLVPLTSAGHTGIGH